MMNLRTQLLFCVFFLVIIAFSARKITCQEVEDEKEFSYVLGSENGPEKWGEIHPEWAACKSGEMQSPIDLLNERRVAVGTHLGKLKRSYKPTNTTILNRGHDVMLRWVGGAGTIQINNTVYELKQCHWHSPSEHTFNGKRFALELHMVHESADKKVAVVGVTYTIGRPDTFLSELMEHIGPIVFTDNEERDVGILDPRHIKIGSRKYYRYVGSLTVPPCTENVVWTMVQKVRTVSREQVRLLRAAVKDESKTNARPVQPIKKHSVHLFRPMDAGST
ncbi:Alpha carbonic anhydrase [Thalictrum thalictroides]|uniref:carbonic anhydrase n=1 Tax=Thalictrum thalictroides TaxID=46969 RepID=A0A7J6X4H0_THATH|nr:Alpha carbonic anhydrase [Thalictrum thalictroides]